MPDPRTLSTADVVAYLARLREELKRRKDELDAALAESAPHPLVSSAYGSRP
jgi:hypothetical protein